MKLPNRVLQLYDNITNKTDLKHSRCELRSILEEVDSDWETTTINGISLTVKPSGGCQNGDEYVDQSTGYLCDDFYGTYYYPIEGSPMYLAISYHC